MTESAAFWICGDCRLKVPMDSAACRCTPTDKRHSPETRYPRDTHDGGVMLRSTLDGYRALDDRSGGLYGKFLRQAAECTLCASDDEIPATKQPIPLMCGLAGLDETNAESFERGHTALESLRRQDGSLPFDPDNDQRAQLLTVFLDKQGFTGLAIGHCGWGDLTARIRGSQLSEGVDLMILGADWYPLTQCSNFLLDRYTDWDHTVQGFMTRLGVAREEVGEFFKTHRVYLGNALLCYRTGWDKTGDNNLSPRSFDNCRSHLKRHIAAVAPRIVVTFGKNPCRSVSAILKGETDATEAALERLRNGESLQKVMPDFYRLSPRRGIVGSLDGWPVTFVPLCHPAWAHVNHYDGDYEAVKELLGLRAIV